MTAAMANDTPPPGRGQWLFSRRTDLLLFTGSAVFACLLSGIELLRGEGDRAIPLWLWVGAVLCVDVAHVFSTLFRVYLDPAARKREPLLYWGTPLLLYVAFATLFAVDPKLFWRVLAYAAVFHFVRQQYGFLKLYQRQERELREFDRRLDTLAIYAATVYPIAYWHAELPRQISWFMDGDFVAVVRDVPALSAVVHGLAPAYWAVLFVFLLRQAMRWRETGAWSTGKVLLVLTTWLCWWFGIIATDSDAVFTLTNVLIHGIPYDYLTFRYARRRAKAGAGGALKPMGRSGAASAAYFGFVIIAFALAEEFAWDRWVFGDHPTLFGDASPLTGLGLNLLVPLLALPQATHYVLDGFIWRGQRLARDYGESKPGESMSM